MRARLRRDRSVLGPPKEVVAACLSVTAIVAVTGATTPPRPATPTVVRPQSLLAGGGAFVGGTGAPTTTTIATAPAPPTTAPTAPTAPDLAPADRAPAGPAPAAASTAPAVAAPPPVPRAPVPAPVVASPLGVYTGAANPGGAAAFTTATGARVAVVEDYLPGGAWNQVDGAGGSLNWMLDAWAGTKYRLLLGVPMFPASGSLAVGATGAYDQYFVTLAHTLVASGEGDAVLRLGQEFTGNWNSWRVTDAVDAADYAEFYRQIVTAMRSVPGQAFRFVWEGADPQGGSYPGAYTALDSYPGDAYVDYVGTDTYDQSWDGACGLAFDNTATAAQAQCQWNEGTAPALAAVAAFAAAHGKPVVFPEWGLAIRGDGHGLGDDPTFVDDMAAWIRGHDVAFAVYFDFDVSGQVDAVTDGNFPASLAAFRDDFG